MAFAIKAEIDDTQAGTFVFTAPKTMYGGKRIAEGDTVFVFASENEGGQGLIARGIVTSAEAIAKKRGIARQTPRVSVTGKDAAASGLQTRQLVHRGTAAPEIKPKLAVQGFYPVGMCGADFGALIRKEYDEYGRVIHEANIKAE